MNNLKRNILITAPSLDPAINVSGISSVVKNIIDFEQDNYHYHHYQLGKTDNQPSLIIYFIKLMWKIFSLPFFIKQNKIDILHQNLPFDKKGIIREYCINKLARLAGCPVVLHVHGGENLIKGLDSRFLRLLSYSLLQNSKATIVLSEIEKKALSRNLGYDHAVILPNSVKIRCSNNKQKSLNEVPTILFLGRIHESKGVDDLIPALESLKGRYPFKFILCGEGPSRGSVVERCNEALEDQFEYKGIVTGDVKHQIISQADIFVLPSRYGEGLPMAMLECMAEGVVPICTDDASIKTVIEHEVTGLIVNKYDIQDLCAKFELIFTNKQMFVNLSMNAAQLVADKYGIEKYMVDLFRLYNNVTGRN